MKAIAEILFLAAGQICLAAAWCHAQAPVAFPLPVSPPTAAAVGMAQQHAQMLALLDSNHNGQLDPAEIEAAQSGLIIPGAAGGAAQAGVNNPAASNQAQFQQFLMNKFDANQNGVLDLREVEAARMALGMAGMYRGAQAGAANQFGQLGGNQAGGNAPAAPKGAPIKNVKRKNALLAQFDKDGDGKLDANERQAMEAARAKGKKAAPAGRRPANKPDRAAKKNER